MKIPFRHAIARSLFATAILAMVTAPLSAQAPQGDDVQSRIKDLQTRLDQLNQQMQSIQKTLDELKGTAAPPAPEQDLTAVETVAPTPAQQQPQTAEAQPAEPSTIDSTALVQNAPNPGASKVFNPDISVIGNFIGRGGDRNPIENRPAAQLEEAELSFQAFVDPYAKANFFIGLSPEGADVEEGYVNFTTLPADFTAKVGKVRAMFGKINTMHTHARPWVDQPLVLTSFFGPDGLKDSGISVSKLIPNRLNIFTEATAEVLSGRDEDVFAPQSTNDLLYLGHLKLFKDLSENSNVELGGSYARGTTPEIGGANQFAGLDLTWRWKPLERSIYRSFVGRTEIMGNDRAGQSQRAWGFYSSADYQFAQRWFTGIRIDRADRAVDPALTDRAESLTLTFWPSEFSQLRGQLRRSRYAGDLVANELLLQLNFAIGAHGAHTF